VILLILAVFILGLYLGEKRAEIRHSLDELDKEYIKNIPEVAKHRKLSPDSPCGLTEFNH
jgi:hypothetical protein